MKSTNKLLSKADRIIRPSRLCQHIHQALADKKAHITATSLTIQALGFACIFNYSTPIHAIEVPFSAKQDLEAALPLPSVRAVETADIDGDGHDDIVVVNGHSTSGRVIWYAFDDTQPSSFSSRNILMSGLSYAYSLTLADIDGDGDIDVAATSFEYGGAAANPSSSIFWLENTGGGNFSATANPVSVIGSDPFEFIASGDIDGDGDIDLAATLQFGYSDATDNITWFENDGTGSFTRHILSTGDPLLTGNPNPRGITIADLNHDGRVDIAVAVFGRPQDTPSIPKDNRIIWFRNDGGAPTFTQFDVGAGSAVPINCSAIDFPNPNVGATHVNSGDINGDGRIELISITDACGDAKNDNIRVWSYNDMSNSFDLVQSIVPVSSAPRHSLPVDLDQDGDLDILLSQNISDELEWYENDGTGALGNPRSFGSSAGKDGALWASVADFDRDGLIDVVGAFEQAGNAAWYRNETIHRSALFPQSANVASSQAGASSIAIADINTDGLPDVVNSAAVANSVSWQQNQSMGPFITQVINSAQTGAAAIAVADVNKDGIPDLVVGATGADAINLFTNDGSGSFTGPIAITGLSGDVSAITVADMDRDGIADIVAAEPGDAAGELRWYRQNPLGTFTEQSAWTSAANGISSIISADLDSDGDLDIVAASSNINTVHWFENLGTGGVGATTLVSNTVTDVSGIAVADVNNDGSLDIISVSPTNNAINWYSNDGSGMFGAANIVSSAFTGASSLTVGDVDFDGDLDIIAASSSAGTLSLFTNNGDGSAWALLSVLTATPGIEALSLYDLKKDGDLDIIYANATSNSIDFIENRGGQFTLPTMDLADGLILDGGEEAVLRIDATHRGRAGDTDAQLITVDLFITDALDSPLNDTQANNLIDSVNVYLDDGDGLFEPSPGDDGLPIASLTTLMLNSGMQTINFVDQASNVQFGFATPNQYFVTASLQADASSQTPDSFKISHITEASSRAEDRDNAIELSLEFLANTISSSSTGQTRVPQLDLDSDNSSGASGNDFSSSFIELSGAVPIVDALDLILTDADSTDMMSATVDIVNDPIPNGVNELLAATTTGSIVANYTSATGVLALTGQDSLSNYVTVLRSLTYNNTFNLTVGVDDEDRMLSVVVTDTEGRSSLIANSNLSVVLLESPILDLDSMAAGSGYSVAFNEGDGATSIVNQGNLTLADADSVNMDSASIVLTNPQMDDVLSADTTGTSIAANFSGATLTLSNAETLANYQAVLNTIQYSNASEDPAVSVRAIEFNVSDGVNSSNVATSLVTVTGFNDAPSVDLNGNQAGTGFNANFTEDLGAVAIVDSAALAIVDVDDTMLVSATATITNFLDPSSEILSAVDLGNISAVFNAGVLEMTGVDTTANYQTLLRGVEYLNGSDNPNETPRVIDFVVNDGTDSSMTAVSTVMVANVNDDPVLDLNGMSAGIDFSTSFTEDMGPTSIVGSMSLSTSDPDDTQLQSATATITNFESGDVLVAQAVGTSVAINYAAGVLTMTGPDSLGNFQSVLRTLTFETGDNPSNATRVVDVLVQDPDLAASPVATSMVIVTPVNDPPVVDLNGVDPGVDFSASYIEWAPSVLLADMNASLVDVDDSVLQSLSYEITNPSDAGDELLLVDTGSTAIVANYNLTNHTLTLMGPDSLANFLAVISNVRYINTLHPPTELPDRIINVIANDGTDPSELTQVSISVSENTEVIFSDGFDEPI